MISLRLAPRQQQQPSWEAAAAVDDMIFDAARHGDERAMIHALIKVTEDELAYTRGGCMERCRAAGSKDGVLSPRRRLARVSGRSRAHL